jgi:hypothetical protein
VRAYTRRHFNESEIQRAKDFAEGLSEDFAKALPEPFAKGTPIQEQEQKPIYASEQNSGSDPKTSRNAKRPTPPSQEANKLTQLLRGEILRNKSDYRVTPKQEKNWALTLDRMIRLDGRTPEQIAATIRWAQRDDFWMTVILSGEKLREKFDQLEMQRNRQRPQPRNVPPANDALGKYRATLERMVNGSQASSEGADDASVEGGQ